MDANLALGRQSPEVAVILGARTFFITVGGEGMDIQIAWIQPAGQQVNSVPFARAFDPTHDNQQRAVFLFQQVELCVEQGFPQSRHLGVIILVRQFVLQFSRFKHVGSPLIDHHILEIFHDHVLMQVNMVEPSGSLCLSCTCRFWSRYTR